MCRFLLFAGLMSLSAIAGAQGLDYNYIQGSYSQVEFDDIDVDGDGFGIGASFGISDRFAVFGSYSTADLDFDVEVNTFDVGLAFHAPISDSVDVVTSVSYVSVDVELQGFGSADDDGFGLGVGLRAMAAPALEINGGISYVDFGDGGDDTTFGAGFLYSFTDIFEVGLAGNWGDDASSYGLNARVYFGN